MNNIFVNIKPVHMLYLVYSIAFLFLSISILVKDMRGSNLKLANNLWLLIMFGFSHGAHEWLKLYSLIERQSFVQFEEIFINLILVILLIVSFLFLLQFGFTFLRNRWLKFIPVALFILCMTYIWVYRTGINMHMLNRLDSFSRNALGLTGGGLTAYGLITYSSKIKNLSLPVSKNLFYSGVAFIFYTIFVGFTYPDKGIPFIVNIPVELLRALSIISVTYFIIKGMNIFDTETRLRYEQQNRLLAQSEKLLSIGQLAAGIAHEINNPLTNVSIGVQTLKKRLKDTLTETDIIEKLNAMEKNIDKASTIAQELLQFSRQKESEFAPFDMNNAINASMTLLRHRLNRITIHNNMSPVPEIMGDHVKFEQVFVNILSNSIDAMPDGGEIFIETFQNNGLVQIMIKDTGVGIPLENLSRIFDPFFTTKEIGQGTGLGLYISYGIIKQHNGSIDITSVEGKGSTVAIKIPITRQDA